MRKVIVYIAMSLDGYIATKNDGVEWLGGDGSDESNFGSFPEFFETIDTVILGYSTYDQIVTVLSPNEWAYKGKQSYVLTHRDIKNDDEEIVFTEQNIKDLITDIKAKDGKNIWICGGANIIKQFHEQGLVDEYSLTIIPTILGDGIRLFDSMESETKLKLKSTKTYNGMVDLVYEVR